MKRTVKIISVIMAVLMLSVICVPAYAEDSVKVRVSVADGELKLAYRQVTVTDADKDGKLTVNDALICAHDANYEGGAEAGYAFSTSEYGPAINKLWGKENGINFFIYINNNSAALGLADEIKAGDHVYAFVIQDNEFWSDTYTYFGSTTAKVKEGKALEITLSGAGYDADWNPITVPVAGAKILIDGKDSGIVTDENGKATVSFDKAGTYTVSASSDTAVIAPPVLVASVSAPAANTGDAMPIVLVTLSALAVFTAAAVVFSRKKFEI